MDKGKQNLLIILAVAVIVVSGLCWNYWNINRDKEEEKEEIIKFDYFVYSRTFDRAKTIEVRNKSYSSWISLPEFETDDNNKEEYDDWTEAHSKYHMHEMDEHVIYSFEADKPLTFYVYRGDTVKTMTGGVGYVDVWMWDFRIGNPNEEPLKIVIKVTGFSYATYRSRVDS